MNGPGAITHQAIEAWGRLLGRDPDALEVEALVAIDVVWRTPPEKGK